MRMFALFASLVVSSLGFADTNAERPNLDDPVVRKKIIEQAVELIGLEAANDTVQICEREDMKPYTGSGWGVFRHPDGEVKALLQFRNGKQHGLSTFFHENGSKDAECFYLNDKKNGLEKSWYNNGQISGKAHWINGKRDGIAQSWYENGQKKLEVFYKKGEFHGTTKRNRTSS